MEELLLLALLLLPLGTAVFINLIGKYLKVNQIAQISSLGLAGAFSISLLLFFLLGLNNFESLSFNYFTWIDAMNVSVGLRWDGLTGVMALLITLLSFIIQLFSVSYMEKDERVATYFVYFNFFVFSMLLLVLSSNFLILFIGWELVGLSSYLLISFWYKKDAASSAGKKAFILNRIGDAGFLIGLMIIFNIFDSFDYDFIFSNTNLLNSNQASLIAFFLMIGAFGKSAQLPLFSWLPDAMEGPTPASALIHAATMVTAGVFMLVRVSPILTKAPNVLFLIAIIGTITAFFASFVAMTQFDIKKILAYSTIAQLGYMFLAVGSGAYVAAIFHLLTHAFFKALLFLGAGAVIHAMDHEQDIRNMGGLIKKMPTTAYTMLIGTLALSGIPPLAGFWSKDEILGSAFVAGGFYLPLWLIGLITAVMTAFYMGRYWILIFLGEERTEQASSAEEVPKLMRVPLVSLAFGSIFVGFVNTPLFHGVEKTLKEVLYNIDVIHPPTGLNFILLASISVLASLVGLFLSNIIFIQKIKDPFKELQDFPLLPKKIRIILGNIFNEERKIFVLINSALLFVKKLSFNALYLDVYGRKVFVDGSKSLSKFVAVSIDQLLIDGLINNLANSSMYIAKKVRTLQSGYLRTYISVFGIMSILLIAFIVLSIGRF